MSTLKKLKFWDRGQKEEPEVPQDIKDFMATRPISNVQAGHVKEKASVKGVTVAAAAVVVFFAGVFVYLFFWVFLFHT